MDSPRLPAATRATTAAQVGLTVSLHLVLLAGAVLVAAAIRPPQASAPLVPQPRSPAVDLPRIIFIARDDIGGGGGGGGNQQPGPIRRAEAPGRDRATLRTIRRAPEVVESTTSRRDDVLPALVLDAKPLASGNVDQIGLPAGGVPFGSSTGPGSGGGVGEGVGTGIGSGRGPGLGPGSGGGTGGGVYRPGGAVSTPRVLVQVRPSYTNEALLRRVQGTVVVELVVSHEGLPRDIRIVRSLDRDLDEQAVAAVSQWRFVPGYLAGRPVDVLVSVFLDFSIH